MQKMPRHCTAQSSAAACTDKGTEACVVRSLELYPLRRSMVDARDDAVVSKRQAAKLGRIAARTQRGSAFLPANASNTVGCLNAEEQVRVTEVLPPAFTRLASGVPFEVDRSSHLRELDRRVAAIVSRRLQNAVLRELQSRQEEVRRVAHLSRRQMRDGNQGSTSGAAPCACSPVPLPFSSCDRDAAEGGPRTLRSVHPPSSNAHQKRTPTGGRLDGQTGGRGASVCDVLASLAEQVQSQSVEPLTPLSSHVTSSSAQRIGAGTEALPFNSASPAAEAMRHFDDKSRAMGSFIHNVARTVAKAGGEEAHIGKTSDKDDVESGGAQHGGAQEGVELVRVMRLKGLAKYNRGLFAGLQTPPTDHVGEGIVYVKRGATRGSPGRHVRTTAWYVRHQDATVSTLNNAVAHRQDVEQDTATQHRSEADLVLAELADASCPRALRSYESGGMSFFQWCDAAAPVRVPRSRYKLETPRGSEDESVVQAVTRVIRERYRKTLSAEERAEARRRVRQHRMRAKIKTEAELAAQRTGSEGDYKGHHLPTSRGDRDNATSSVEDTSAGYDAVGRDAEQAYTYSATFIDGDEPCGRVRGTAEEMALDTLGHRVTPQPSSSFFGSSSRSLIPFARRQSMISEESQMPLVEHTMPGDALAPSVYDDEGNASHSQQPSVPPVTRAGKTGSHRAERWRHGRQSPNTAPASASHERLGDKAELRNRGDHRLHASSEFAESVSHRKLSLTAHPPNTATVSSKAYSTHDDQRRRSDADAEADARSSAAAAVAAAADTGLQDVAVDEARNDDEAVHGALVPHTEPRGAGDGEDATESDVMATTTSSATPLADDIVEGDEHELLLASFAERQGQSQQGSAHPRTGGAKSVLQGIAAALEDSGRVSDLLDDSRDGLHRHALFTPRAMFSGRLSVLGLEDARRTVSRAEDNVEDGTANEAARRTKPSREEVVTGFVLSEAALREKFRREAEEANAALLAERDALRTEVEAQRALLTAFGTDVHHLSRGVKGKLSADAFAVALTQEVNAYARRTGLEWAQLATPSDALTVEAASEAYLRHFSRGQVTTRETACQVTEEDLGCVDTTVRETEAAMEDLFSHEKGLLQSIKLATIAVANIMSFHSSLEVEATCKECFCILEQPRTLWPCGHTFCQRCLAEMYNTEEELVCAECHSLCEVGYTPNWSVEMMANYQVVRQDTDNADPFATPSTQLGGRVQTIEGVLRRLLQELVAVQTHFYSDVA